jgi:hypothetical protein
MVDEVKPIFLLGEAQTSSDAKINSAFCSSGGIELLRMLSDANLLELTAEDRSFITDYYNHGDPTYLDMVWRLHPEFYRSNVFALNPDHNDLANLCGPKSEAIPGYPPLVKGKGYIHDRYRPHLERLADELVTVDPNLVLCLGNSALWALTSSTGVAKLRGTTMVSSMLATGFKLLPTYHPSAVVRQWELRPTVVADLMKARRQSLFPEIRRPKREIWIAPTLEDLSTFRDRYIANCEILSVDIETAGTAITEIGFAPDESHAIVVPFLDRRAKSKSYWPDLQSEQAAWRCCVGILEDRTIPKLFQNGLYDIAFLLRAAGIGVRGAAEDTMLLHHALQPESLKGLGFLGSLYCDEGAWKGMRKHVTTIKRDE